jgi:hypothetical protein
VQKHEPNHTDLKNPLYPFLLKDSANLDLKGHYEFLIVIPDKKPIAGWHLQTRDLHK